MQVRRVAGALGAELQAINLGEGIDAALAGTLRDLLNEHEVLFLRDQVIAPAAQKQLAEIFGPLQTHPAYSTCLLYTSPSPRDKRQSRMPSSA